MNGLTVGLDLSPLTGLTLEQLRFGEHQVQLAFAQLATVAVEGACKLTRPEMPTLIIDDFAGEATALCGLLGQVVRYATRTPSGGLSITFQDGSNIELVVDTERFESFQLQFGGRTYIG